MRIKTTVIGAGVIGLAVAERLAGSKGPLLVIERNPAIGQETSSRNSEVIHAGIYYPRGSLKSELCRKGRLMLYERCRAAGIRHLRCGKLIVATSPEEESRLEKIKRQAEANGVNDLRLLSAGQTRQMEPLVRATAALFSPSTGIIDSHRLMRHLAARARRAGALFFFRTTVETIRLRPDGRYTISVRYRDGKTDTFATDQVVNCAGLEADRVAACAGIDIDACRYRQHFWKGEYFSCDLPAGFIKHLVYPVPLPANVGLGIHATIDLAGRIRLGPNATYLPDRQYDYTVSMENRKLFHRAARRYFPDLKEEQLQPEMAGIRPKLQKPGDGVRDFIIQEESGKGLPRLVNCIGIESPGLTSCLAIAGHVASVLEAGPV